jgi:hypothetical protein
MGRLKVMLCHGVNLAAKDVGGTSDPYVNSSDSNFRKIRKTSCRSTGAKKYYQIQNYKSSLE